MAKDHVITAIDVGSSKIVCLIAEVDEEGRIQVIGVSSIPSRGVKKGVIVDIDQAVDAFSETIESAERMAGVQVSRVWATINGSHISSVNSQGVVAVSSPDGEISANDVARVTEAARAISIPSSRDIIHVVPRTFVVDQQSGIDDPVGMSGVRLQIETHIITGAATSMKNLVRSIQEVGLDVNDLVFAGLASSYSVLTDTEKELGVVMVDIGGGTTDIVVYHEGAPVYSSVLKLGGKNITSDIAIGLRVPLEDAEKIKKFVSEKPVEPALSNERKKKEGEEKQEEKDEDMLDISSLGLASIQKVDKKFLVEGIIEPRLEEIADEILQEMKRSGYEDLTPAGFVVSGGAAMTVGLERVFADVLDMPIRIGKPTGVSGLIDEIRASDYAASIGTLIFAVNSDDINESFMSSIPGLSFGGVKRITSGITDFFKGLLP